ncbi:MAG: ABC transporter permease subunit, partial [Hungatella sp.]
LLNMVRNQKFKKVVQTTIYAPHFISAVVIVGMINLFLSPTSGIINKFIAMFGGTPQMFMGDAGAFPAIFVISEIWQTMGYNSIVYIAALSGVSPELHESAIVDGATAWQRIRYIDLPSIMPTIIILLIMNAGRILTIGYEKIYLMQNTLNRAGSEVISTYVYKQAFGASGLPSFSYASAIGLFESVVSLAMLLLVNYIASKYSDTSLI